MFSPGRGALGSAISASCFFMYVVMTFAHSMLYCVGLYVGLLRNPAYSKDVTDVPRAANDRTHGVIRTKDTQKPHSTRNRDIVGMQQVE